MSRPASKVILITGAPTIESATQAIEHGVFRYLSKPFDTEPGWGVSSINFDLKALLGRAESL